MPPKKQGNQYRTAVDEIYGHDDLDRRIEQMIDERIVAALERRVDVIGDRLIERLSVLMGEPRNINPVFEMKVEIPKFHFYENPIFDNEEDNDIFNTDDEPVFEIYDDKEDDVFEPAGDGKPIFDTDYAEEEIQNFDVFPLIGKEIDTEITKPELVDPVKEDFFIRQSLSPYTPLTPKKDHSWRIYVISLKRLLHVMVKIRGRILSNVRGMMRWAIMIWLMSILKLVSSNNCLF